MSTLAIALLLSTAVSAPEVALAELRGNGMSEAALEEVFKSLHRQLQGRELKLIGDACAKNQVCLAVELTRVGPLLQVATRASTHEGEMLHEESRSLSESDPLLSDALLDVLQKVAAERTVKKVDDEIEPQDPPGASPMSTFAWAGVGLASVGGVVALAGATVATLDALTLSDATSSGKAKEDAAARGPGALVVTAIGTACVIGGVVLLVASPQPAQE